MALKRLRRRRDFQVIPIEELEEEIADEKSFEDELLRREAEEIFYEAMEGLDAEDRGMLWGRLSGESYRELSKRYGKSVGAVKMRVRRAKEKVRERVLRRLSCVVMGPWREIIEVIGGVVMKVTTKVAITGVSLLMLGGIGVWIVTNQDEEEPIVKPGDVKVERQVNIRPPKRMSISKLPLKEEEDELTFEEFNRLLDEYFESMEESSAETASEVGLNRSESGEVTKVSSVESQEKRFFGLTFEEHETRLPLLEVEIEANLRHVIELNDYLESTHGIATLSPEIAKMREEVWKEMLQRFQYVSRELVMPYLQSLYVVKGKLDPHPLKKGGWIYDMMEGMPMMIVDGAEMERLRTRQSSMFEGR